MADDMKRDAFWAVGIALVCMFLYILLGSHDRLLCGRSLRCRPHGFPHHRILFGMLGIPPFSMEIDQSFIAAVLTIIGYQINDTVVVFDRVREMMKVYPKEDRFITFNKSLNTTLSRTVMTSFSTLLVLLCIFFLGGDTLSAHSHSQ